MARRPRGRQSGEPANLPLFEICVHGVPVSAQAKDRARLRDWKERVRAAAAAAWPPGRPPLLEEVVLHVTHFCEAPLGDTDNLAKPIRDALEGVVYTSDRQVKDGLGNRRNINGAFRIRFMSPALAAAFSHGGEFVRVRVWLSPTEEDLD